MKETRTQREKRMHRELLNNIIEVRQYDYTEGYKITVKYVSGATRTYKNEPSWFIEYIEDSWSIMQETFNVYGSYEHIHNNYSPVKLEAPEEEVQAVEAEETSTPAEVADRATAEIFHIIDKMPENSGLEYVKNAIHTTPAAPKASSPLKLGMQFFAQQKYTSANTSINNDKIPAVFSKLINNSIKLGINPANSIILDSGCGKYPEIISEYLLDSGCEYAGRDPYNQPEYINNIVFPTKCKNAEALKKHRIFTSSNVLNVIPGLDNRIAYINSIKDIMQAGEKLYITIYPGDSSGIGRPTNEDCWQENRKYKEYIPELEAAGFTSVKPKYGMLICEL